MHFGHFFENRKNSGLTPGQSDDPVTRTWKMTQMTHWPGDPMTQFHVWRPASMLWPTRTCVRYLKYKFKGEGTVRSTKAHWNSGTSKNPSETLSPYSGLRHGKSILLSTKLVDGRASGIDLWSTRLGAHQERRKVLEIAGVNGGRSLVVLQRVGAFDEHLWQLIFLEHAWMYLHYSIFHLKRQRNDFWQHHALFKEAKHIQPIVMIGYEVGGHFS